MDYEKLTQYELFRELNDLRAQGKTVKEIAAILEKGEGTVKNLLTAVNILNREIAFRHLLEDNASVTILDFKEINGLKDIWDGIKLLEQKAAGKITRAQLREKVKKKRGIPKTLKSIEDIINSQPEQSNIIIDNEKERTFAIVLESGPMYDRVTDRIYRVLREMSTNYDLRFTKIDR